MAKILYVVNDPAFFVSHRLPLAVRARALGVEVVVVGPDGPKVQVILAEGARYVAVPLDRASGAPAGEMRTLVSIAAALRRERPHLVHTVSIKPVIYGGLAARALGIPALVSSVSGLGYVFAATGAAAEARRRLVRALYKAALRHGRSRVIFQNASDMNTLVAAGCLPLNRAELIGGGSGVPLDAFDPRPASGRALVVLIARMLRDKGVVEFVDAARRLRGRGTGARFVLVGGIDSHNPAGLSRAELLELTGDGAVEWVGQRSDVAEILRDAHIVCLPSYREGMPKVLLEAAAAGRAVVTTDVPGCRDAVREGVTGLLVPPGDAAALASALGELLADPDRVRSMGHAGRRLAEAEFSVDRVVDAVFDVYRMVAPPELMVALGQPDR